MKRKKIAKKVLKQIKAGKYDQHTFAEITPCGTVACCSGWVSIFINPAISELSERIESLPTDDANWKKDAPKREQLYQALTSKKTILEAAKFLGLPDTEDLEHSDYDSGFDGDEVLPWLFKPERSLWEVKNVLKNIIRGDEPYWDPYDRHI